MLPPAIRHIRPVDLKKRVIDPLILEIKPITLVRQIDLLEEAGLVRRNKDSEDRRAYRIELMPKAHAVMQELWEIADAVEAQVLSTVTIKEQELLTILLERIKNSINANSLPEDSALDE